MQTLQIGLEEFKQVAAAIFTTAKFGNAEEQIKKSPRDALQWLTDYVEFNRVAAYGVAALTGKMGFAEPFGRGATDRASGPFHAAIAIEEMGTDSQGYLDTHAVISRSMLEAVAGYFGLPVPKPSSAASKWANIFYKVYSGSSVNLSNPLCAAALVGFHVGSEGSAVEEFKQVFELFQKHHPDLMEHLKETDLKEFPGIKADTWLACHGGTEGVEEDHVNHAYKASKIVITTDELFKAWERGVKRMIKIVNGFFTGAEPQIAPKTSPKSSLDHASL